MFLTMSKSALLTGTIAECDDPNSRFRFFFGSKECECSVGQAYLLSPYARFLMQGDLSVDCLYLTADCSYLDELLPLAAGKSIVVDESNLPMLASLLSELGNKVCEAQFAGIIARSAENVVSESFTASQGKSSFSQMSCTGSHFMDADSTSTQ